MSGRVSVRREVPDAAAEDEAMALAIAEESDAADGRLAAHRKLTEKVNTASTYTAGILAFLSGCVTLVTQTWQNPELPLGINMVAASFEMYFSSFGVAIIIFCTFLFGIGTILGNNYNGGQCFAYLMDNKKNRYYIVGATTIVFIGAVAEVKILWSFMDLILASMAVPHMATLLRHVFKKTTPAMVESKHSA